MNPRGITTGRPASRFLFGCRVERPDNSGKGYDQCRGINGVPTSLNVIVGAGAECCPKVVDPGPRSG